MQKLSAERAGYQAMLQKMRLAKCQQQSSGGTFSILAYSPFSSLLLVISLPLTLLKTDKHARN